ncbi:transposase [bacterium B13(2017)]|nr:transposase [bacterium B13(2017)]
MARLARVVVPEFPHHVIQRGNRKQKVFFSEDDKRIYLNYLEWYAKPAGIKFWAYCLMDNHVHLVAVPETKEGLAYGLGETHRRYTRMIHFREDWHGYLWEGRFKSYPLSEAHLFSTIRYIERNPVRAGMLRKAEDYPWSSANAHVNGKLDKILSDNFMISKINNWKEYLSDLDNPSETELVAKHMTTGRPLGDETFIEKIETLTNRCLKKKKPGPKINN